MRSTRIAVRDNLQREVINFSSKGRLRSAQQVIAAKYAVVCEGPVKHARAEYLVVPRLFTELLISAGFGNKARVLFEDVTHNLSYVTSMKLVGNKYYIYIPKALVKFYGEDETVRGFVTPLEAIS